MKDTKILVVEDEGIIAKDIQYELINAGYQVPMLVSSGEQALSKGMKSKPDLVLMDIVLQGKMDGIVTARQIRSSWDVPIIFLTAYADPTLLERAKETEPIGYILKPFNKKSLLVTIEIALSNFTSQRNRAEELLRYEKLKTSEMSYRRLFESAQDGILILDAKSGEVLDVNPFLKKMLGYSHKEFLGKKLWDIGPFIDIKTSQKAFQELQNNEHIRYENLPLQTKDGHTINVEFNSNIYSVDHKQVIQCNIRDITERMQAEIALNKSLDELRRFAMVINDSNDAIILYDFDGNILAWNHGATESYGYTEAEALKMNARDIVAEPDRESALSLIERIKQGETVTSFELRRIAKDGQILDIWLTITLLTDISGKPVAIATTERDITESKHKENQIQRQLEHMAALRNIDLAISGRLNLKQTLHLILEQIITQLKMDAADVLLFNPLTQTLDYHSSQGFHAKAIKPPHLDMGTSLAGLVVRHRKTIAIPDLTSTDKDFSKDDLFSDEGFVTYFGVPLIMKNEIKGVLEIFHRTQFVVTKEWLNFMETLGGQVSIAVDNAQLFSNMQLSNQELISSNDATIESLSYALDLRDKETEGHSKRVTEMTVNLAHLIDLDEEVITQIRRGALLHDIGKLGVPDSILLKPEPLSEEEWVIMKKHTQYANDILSPISFLHPALDIPYCHHEKWDGTGYPRGLKGESIPLSARLFAVVDVFDALTSERPYRPAWSKKKTLAHIQKGSGAHFDPSVVPIFIKMQNGLL